MRTRVCLAALILAASSSVFAAPTASAQEKDAVVETARRRFQEGVKFFDAKKYEEARAAFLQAYALKHHPAVLLNLAQSEIRSGHPFEAARHFSAYLRESATAPGAERTEAEKGLAAARTKLGKILVAVGAGADLLLDGEPVGQAPLAEPLDVAPGTHTIEGRHAGRTATTTVSVQMGKSVTATIALETNPPAVAFPVPVAPMPSASPVAPPPGPETPPDVASRDVAPLPGEELQVSTAGRENFFSWLGHNGVGLAGVGVAAIGLGVFAGFGLAANKASDNSESVSDEIRAEGSRRNISRSNLCANPVEMGFETACRVLRDNRDVRDSDKMVATVGLVAAGVGVAATVTAYLVTSKNSGAAKVNPPSRAVVAPLFGVHESGLAVVGAF